MIALSRPLIAGGLDPTTSRAELRELHAFQREVSSWIQIPDGAADILDYKKGRVLGVGDESQNNVGLRCVGGL